MKYRVINQKVEINGVTREIGAVLEEGEFRPKPDHPATEDPEVNLRLAAELSELQSLLATKHVEETGEN